MRFDTDPRFPKGPATGYVDELVHRLYVLWGFIARRLNVLSESAPASFPYDSASINAVFFTASRPMIASAIHGRVTVAGTDAGAVTAIVRKVPDTVAITSGTALHTGTFNVKGAANTVQELSMAILSDDLKIAEGDSIAVDFTGVLTAATGSISVFLDPA